MPVELRLIVAGCRDFDDYSLLENKLDKLLEGIRHENIVIVSGDCRGADLLGVRYAKERGIRTVHFPADWEAFGRSAGPRRNKQMAAYAAENNHGALAAFWDGRSKGTKNMIENAKEYHLQIRIIKI